MSSKFGHLIRLLIIHSLNLDCILNTHYDLCHRHTLIHVISKYKVCYQNTTYAIGLSLESLMGHVIRMINISFLIINNYGVEENFLSDELFHYQRTVPQAINYTFHHNGGRGN